MLLKPLAWLLLFTGALLPVLTTTGLAACLYRFESLAQFPSSPLREISGLVRGSGQFWWTHNDSGGTAALYALDDGGKLLGQVNIADAVNVDWEDLAGGPCPERAGRCLYIGDFGNNRLQRDDQVIYVLREPAATATRADVLLKLPVRFDKPANTEALVYDPLSKQLLIVTKEYSGIARVYARSLDPANSLAKPVAQFDLSTRELGDNLITGAAISEDGKTFLLRSYFTAFRWERSVGESWAQLFSRPAQTVALAREPQGEAIATVPGSSDFYTISEEKPVLWRYSCR